MSFLLDTNVLSETRRIRPNPRVMAWLDGAEAARLFVSVLTVGELHKGVALRRRTDPLVADRLAAWVETIETTFADRILAVDESIARLWGRLSAARAAPVIDTLIAATALSRSLTLVTRNTKDVQFTGVVVIDPWQD